MPEHSTHRGHRQPDTHRKNQQVGQTQARRPRGRGQYGEDGCRACETVQSTDHERAMLVVMALAMAVVLVVDLVVVMAVVMRFRVFMRMPMSVRRQPLVLMKMQMPTSTDQIDQYVDPEQHHCAAHRAFSNRCPSRRQSTPQPEKQEARRTQDEAMPERPAKARLDAFARALFPSRENGERHHMVRIEGMQEPQPKGENEPRKD